MASLSSRDVEWLVPQCRASACQVQSCALARPLSCTHSVAKKPPHTCRFLSIQEVFGCGPNHRQMGSDLGV
ncbi:hypothetical protein Q7C36_001467 [Tachysurus vachellii]|uniref:Uncharacterized protein n=1 Tax=Tachysurus vachellii TaxID=175792 RepID=A0AA88P127_TACVA|nr:hypothetical protein Q7C36_001467 [Tachysurus vachellii]